METYKLVAQIRQLGNLHKSRTIVSIKFEDLMQRTSVHYFMGKKLNGPQEIKKHTQKCFPVEESMLTKIVFRVVTSRVMQTI